MAAQLDSKQLKKIANANLGSADITKDHAEFSSSPLVAPGNLVSGAPKVPYKASPRKGSFVNTLKDSAADSPRKTKTPEVSPLLSFFKLTIVPPTHLDLASAVTQHFDSGSSDSAQPHTSGDKVKSK